MAVARFVAMIDRLMLVAAAPVEEILGHVLTESGYRALLEQSEDEEDQERLANIEELLTAARQFDEQHAGQNSLEGFLEEASLVADVDAWDADTDRVTLMTLHASKGLEFPVVFIIALEEGLIPHERSRTDDDAVEEERRLLFVGMTRAKEELQLSRAIYREFRGQRRMTIPSPFLLELPRDELRMVEPGCYSRSWDQVAPRKRCGTTGKGKPPKILPTRSRLPFRPPSFRTRRCRQRRCRQRRCRHRRCRRRRLAVSPLAGLKTAAELTNAPPPPKRSFPVEVFVQGMLVRHPKYGLGKIIALGGSGATRQATVDFASGAGQRKFRLAASELRPAVSE